MKPVPSITWTDVGGREAALIQRCAAGDEDACAELVAEHQRMVYQLSLNLLERPQRSARPLAGSVPARLPHHSRLPRPVRASAPGSTASSSTRRGTVSGGGGGATARSRSRSTSTSSDHGELPAPGNGGRPTGCSGRSSWPNGSGTALDRLPFDQQTAIVLREIDGLSYEEIGFSLGIAVGTVKSRLARAREALRAQLRDV